MRGTKYTLCLTKFDKFDVNDVWKTLNGRKKKKSKTLNAKTYNFTAFDNPSLVRFIIVNREYYCVLPIYG